MGFAQWAQHIHVHNNNKYVIQNLNLVSIYLSGGDHFSTILDTAQESSEPLCANRSLGTITSWFHPYALWFLSVMVVLLHMFNTLLYLSLFSGCNLYVYFALFSVNTERQTHLHSENRFERTSLIYGYSCSLRIQHLINYHWVFFWNVPL